MWERGLATVCCSSSRRPSDSLAIGRILSLRGLSSSSFSTLATPEVAGKSLEGGGGGGGGAKRTLIRRVIPVLLLSITGGVALSAINDLAIFHGCSSKAIEKASQNQRVLEALGEPIVRGPWYDASLAVGHRRHSVSCTFPVSGPQGTGIFQLKAVRTGDDSWFSFLRHHDWDILIMEALLHVPSNEEKNRTFRINLTDRIVVPPVECKDCCSPEKQSTNEK